MTTSKRFMRKIRTAMIVFAICNLHPLVIFADGFVFQWSSCGEQLALWRKIDDSPESCEVLDITVFELVDDGTSLRRLHATTLLPGSKPLAVHVSPCGRFIVTMDEWTGAGNTDKALVVYDSFRKESTSFRLEQFLSNPIIEKLPRHGFLKGVKWHDWGQRVTSFDQFSITGMKFYPTFSEKMEAFNAKSKSDSSKAIPFIEIDLIKRAAKIVPAINTVPINLEREIASHSKYHWTAINDSSVAASLNLPSRLEGSAEKGATVRMVFTLESTGDYQLLRKE